MGTDELTGRALSTLHGKTRVVILLMGVSGSGKTTLGRRLAARLGCPLLEGDDFHSPANIKKMSAGKPLTDKDRLPWLTEISSAIQTKANTNQACIVACSALKRRYRKLLLSNITQAKLIYLKGNKESIAARMNARTHFMPPALLQSQFDTLEPPTSCENALVVDISQGIEECMQYLIKELKLT